MKSKKLATSLTGLAIVTLMAATPLVSAPAHARAYCVYAAEDISGNRLAAAGTHRKKMSTACDRARRQCNRKLDRKHRQGKFGRTHGCLKIAAEHK